VNWLFLLAVAIAKIAVFFLVLLVGKEGTNSFEINIEHNFT
jgi:hypothetical protein